MVKRFFMCTLVTFVLALTFATVVLAADAYSPLKSYTVYNYDYTNQAMIWGSNFGLQARTKVLVQDYESVPVGYIGLVARLYDDNGIFGRVYRLDL